MVLFSYKKGTGHSFALILPKYMFFRLSRDIIRSTARFTSCSHPTFWDSDMESKWLPTCDLCDTDDVQDEQHVLFHCANPYVISLCRKYNSVSLDMSHDVSTFLSQNNNKL